MNQYFVSYKNGTSEYILAYSFVLTNRNRDAVFSLSRGRTIRCRDVNGVVKVSNG